MCETLGITPDEYWDFIFAAQEHLKEREPEYAHIPDIRNAPVAPILINLAIGIALSAIGYLLAPKPKAPAQENRRADLSIEGSQGRTRYTKSSNFDSVQKLANLGAVIPLIFANREQNEFGVEYGGVRVDTDMLFSQMISSGNNQLLHAVLMLGLADIDKPDFDGLAVGDLLIRDFSKYKSRLYFTNGGRMNGKNHKYTDSQLDVPESSDNPDAFGVWWPRREGFMPYFSGARTPSTKTQFGCYSPLPNGYRFLVPYELVMNIEGSGKDNREAADRKRDKIAYPFPRMCGVTEVKNNVATYKIDGEEQDPSPSEFRPWGAADARSTQDETRIQADEVLQENQQYMIGQSIATLISRPPTVWVPEEKKNAFYYLRIDEKVGRIPTCGATGENDRDEGGEYPWKRGTVQQVAIAALSNNRPCDATEIGIKSEVWRRMVGAANFNGHPTPETIESYEEDGANITLGTVTKYMKRYSMFKLYARPLGDKNWIDINGNVPFVVRGVSPTPHYNTIHINHPGRSMHEFKIVPVPGAAFYDKLNAGTSFGVYLLDGSVFKKPSDGGAEPSRIDGNNGGYLVYYTGHSTTISFEDAQNKEWIVTKPDEYADPISRGPIAQLERYQNQRQPLIPDVPIDDKRIGDRYVPTGSSKSLVLQTLVSGREEIRFYWAGRRLQGKINGKKIEVQEGSKTYLYDDGERKQPFREADWDEPRSRFLVQLSTRSNQKVIYHDCVYRVPNKNEYRYRWNNQTVKTTRNKQNGYVYDGSKTRYKIGTKVGDQEEIWYDVEPSDIYKAKGDNDQNIIDGARVLANGDFEFHRNNKKIGTTGNRNLPYGNGRWQATDRVQTAKEYSEEKVGQVRIANEGVDAPIDDVVTTGCVVVGRDPKDNRRIVRIYVDGEKVFSGRDPDPVGTFRRIRVGDFIYVPNYNQPAIRVGQRGDKKACFKLIKFKVTDARYEQWAITFQTSVVTAERYFISRERLEPGQDGHWEIVKTEINRTKPEDPKESDVDIISVRNPNRRSTARARLEEWSNGGKRWKVIKPGRNYVEGEQVEIGNNGPKTKVTGIETDNSTSPDDDTDWSKMTSPGNNYSPLNAICDYFINSTDESSHSNGPEHSVVFCNELISQNNNEVPQYKDLALLGLKITNSKEWTSFNNLSAWIGKGLRVTRLADGNTVGPTHLFPDIAYALLTDPKIGAGNQIGAASVDRAAMREASIFCKANGFYWDGVIDQKLNLREFIFEQAAYILCDFTIKGGRFALVPSVPYNQNGKIQQKGKPKISALFTDGNVRDMSVTFLSPEERQPFVAVAMFREEVPNGFAETRTIRVKLKGGSDTDPIEEFDMTQFCTNPAQAEIFCKVALKLREQVDHGIKFETTPQSAMNLEPGQYFRFASKVTHTDRFHSGSVDAEGNVNSSIPLSRGSFRVVYWRPNETSVQETNMVITGTGKTSTSKLFGTLWTKAVERDEARIYKVETLAYSEDGLCTVTGSHVPLTDNGTLATLDWEDGDFDVEVA